MSLKSKFLNRLFRRVSGLVWDLTTGQIGFQTNDGVYSLVSATSADAGTTYSVSVNPFDVFTQPLPAFAMQTPFDEVQATDVIVGSAGIIGWVTEVGAASFKVVDHNGSVKQYAPPKVNIAGGMADGVLVVRNLFTLAGGSGPGSEIGQLIATLSLAGKDDQVEKLLPLLLAGQASGGFGNVAAPQNGAAPQPFNPMMMLALTGGLGGKGGKSDLLTMMALSGGLGGAPGAVGGMGMMLPLLLAKDGGGDKSDLLTMMALSGGLGGAGAGGMNPMMLLALTGGLSDDTPAAPALQSVSAPRPATLRQTSGLPLQAPALRVE